MADPFHVISSRSLPRSNILDHLVLLRQHQGAADFFSLTASALKAVTTCSHVGAQIHSGEAVREEGGARRSGHSSKKKQLIKHGYLLEAFSFLLHEVILLELVVGVVLMPTLQKIKPTAERSGR